MNEIDRKLLEAALIKWMQGEVMSIPDANRIVQMIDTCPLQATGEPAQLAALQVRLRSVIGNRFMGQNAGK